MRLREVRDSGPYADRHLLMLGDIAVGSVSCDAFVPKAVPAVYKAAIFLPNKSGGRTMAKHFADRADAVEYVNLVVEAWMQKAGVAIPYDPDSEEDSRQP